MCVKTRTYVWVEKHYIGAHLGPNVLVIKYRFHLYKSCLLAVLLTLSLSLRAQTSSVTDSLLTVLEKTTDETLRVDLYNTIAWYYLDTEDSLALIYASDGLKIAEKIGYEQGMKYAYTLIGQSHASFAEYTEAFKNFRLSQRIPVNGNYENQAYNHYAVAFAFDQLGQYDSAAKNYDKSIAISQRHQLTWRLGMTYIKYASNQAEQGYFNNALQWLTRAEDLRENLPGYFDSYLYPAFAKIYLDKKDFAQAEKYQVLASKIPERHNTVYGQVEYQLNQCQWFLNRGNLKEALQSALNGMELLKQLKNNKYIIRAYVNLGNVYYELYQNLTAISYCEQALKISKQYELNPLTAQILNQLGWFHHDLKEEEVALDYARQSLAIHETLNNPYSEIRDYTLMGLIYTEQKKYAEAFNMYEKAMSPDRLRGNKFIEPDILYNMSFIYEDKGDIKKGIEQLRKALAIDRQLDNKLAVCSDFLAIGKLQIKLNQPDSAKHSLKQGYEIASQLGSRQLQLQLLTQFSNIYEKEKNFEQAYRYARSINALKDSITLELNSYQVEEMRAFFLVESKEKEIELLNNRMALNKSQLDLQDLTIISQRRIILGAIILIALINVFLFYSYTTNKRLTSARESLLKLNESLVTIMKEEKLLNEQLRITQEEALAANKAKTEFVANISHELRTPLNAVIGFAEVLEQQVTNPAHTEFVRHILAGGKNLLAIVNDILDLSKMEAGKIGISYSFFNMESVIKDINSLFTLTANQKKLVFDCKIEQPFPEQVLLDEIRIKQIIINLLSNAFKFTETGKVSLTLSAVLTSTEEAEVSIRVCDTGIGISKEDQKYIFNAFSQVDQKTTRKYGGTGLGLTISKRLVTEMNGEIKLSSNTGEGAVFTVLLHNVKIS